MHVTEVGHVECQALVVLNLCFALCTVKNGCFGLNFLYSVEPQSCALSDLVGMMHFLSARDLCFQKKHNVGSAKLVFVFMFITTTPLPITKDS